LGTAGTGAQSVPVYYLPLTKSAELGDHFSPPCKVGLSIGLCESSEGIAGAVCKGKGSFVAVAVAAGAVDY